MTSFFVSCLQTETKKLCMVMVNSRIITIALLLALQCHMGISNDLPYESGYHQLRDAVLIEALN